MKNILLSLVVLPILGCPMGGVNPLNSALPNSDKCPDKPTQTLQANNVKPVTLPAKLSDTASQEIQIGYIFEGQAGQKLNIGNIDNLCVWVYSPENQLLSLTDLQLPITGKYTVQVSSSKVAKKFDIDINIANAASLVSPSPQPSNFIFSKSNYPRSSCGDPLPKDPKVYPINFYPVEVPNSVPNLNKARSLFCRDAFPKTSDNVKLIQIVSFTSKEKAQAFAALVGAEINGTKVGTPTTRVWGK